MFLPLILLSETLLENFSSKNPKYEPKVEVSDLWRCIKVPNRIDCRWQR